MLKRISVNDAVEHEYELASTKEILGNTEVNQRKMFIGIEQGTGKNKQNMLALMHVGIMVQMKDWKRNNYGSTCLFVDEIVCESSVVLHEQETPGKAKDVEECLNCEISGKKTKVKKNTWNLQNNICFPKETRKNEIKIDEEVDSDENTDDSFDNQSNETDEIDTNSDGK